MPPPGYEPFLQAICATPADDAPRLVYADWLDENDAAERAAFIRLQIALYRAKQGGNESVELVARVRSLRETAELVWRPQMPALRGVSWHRYWRGFISGADFHSAYWFFKQSAIAFETVPLQFMRLHGLRPAHAEKFAACEWLNRLEGLTLLGEPYLLLEEGWRILAESPHLQYLRSLQVLGRTQTRGGLLSPLMLNPNAGAYLSANFENLEELVIRGPLAVPTIQLFRKRFGSGFVHQP